MVLNWTTANTETLNLVIVLSIRDCRILSLKLDIYIIHFKVPRKLSKREAKGH